MPRKNIRTPEKISWFSMRRRCSDPKTRSYKFYGAKGIRVCPEWQNSFSKFLRDMGPRPSPDHSIDRIDSCGDYEPKNCRWATRAEQGANRRNVLRLTVKGETKRLREWIADTGMPGKTLWNRLKAQGAIDPTGHILSPRNAGTKLLVCHGDATYSVAEISKLTELSLPGALVRVRRHLRGELSFDQLMARNQRSVLRDAAGA